MSGTFIAARLSRDSQIQLKNLAAIIGVPPRECKDLHVTVGHSKVAVPYKPLHDLAVPVTATRLSVIGQYVAVLIDSGWLKNQYKLVRLAGGTWDFSGYIPHVSLCKINGRTFDLALGNNFVKDLCLVITSTYKNPLR